ncbi:hypothetical protein GIB67_040609 [Kingdonia uniflora]|uniref:Uncharacterized protein n=1 Tax=Kingdonia uniflora TaxID=39325 RepID=A0A7J7M8Y6_9MAGN|nr:hypothetical protein GIB67_040609 [Kingdonia uniflora]
MLNNVLCLIELDVPIIDLGRARPKYKLLSCLISSLEVEFDRLHLKLRSGSSRV